MGTTTEQARQAVYRGAQQSYYQNYAILAARRAAKKYNLNPDELAGTFSRMIDTESGYDPTAYNADSTASGIAQIVPQWHPGVDPWNPEKALDYAADYFGGLTRRYGGDVLRGAAAYNWGPGNVDQLAGTSFQQFYGSLPDETRRYIDNVGGGGPITPPDTGTGGYMPFPQGTGGGGGNEPAPPSGGGTPGGGLGGAVGGFGGAISDFNGPFPPPYLEQIDEYHWIDPQTHYVWADEGGEKLRRYGAAESKAFLDSAGIGGGPGGGSGLAAAQLGQRQAEFEFQKEQTLWERALSQLEAVQANQALQDKRQQDAADLTLKAAPYMTAGREYFGGFEPYGAAAAVANYAGVPYTPAPTFSAQVPLQTQPAPVDPRIADMLARIAGGA